MPSLQHIHESNQQETENPSDVLLNPSDPEATFRYKAGGKNLGYVGNVVESVGEKGSLITDYAYEKNIYADNQFMKDYLERQDTFDDGAFLVADGSIVGLYMGMNCIPLF